MIKIPKHIVLSSLLILFIGVSCIKNDLEEIDENLVFSPEYSFPIGDKTVCLEEFINKSPVPITDTVGIPIEQIFDYDGNYYYSPSTLYKTHFLKFDFSKLSQDFDSIQSIMFRVNSVNKIPAQCELQVYFSSGDGTDTDLMFTDGWYKIEPAQISSEGDIIASEQYKKDTYYDKDGVQKFFNKRTIIISIKLSVDNPSDEIIKYLSTQSLDIQFALRFSFESNTNEI